MQRTSFSVRFLTPSLPPQEAIDRYFERSREAAWFSNFGPCHELLVERLEAYLGGGVSCVPVANCTLGLMIALRATAGLPEPGRREVILPSFTFAAAIEAVLWAGFEPVFADVEQESWHLAPEAVSGALRSRGNRVAAVLACSTFGTPPSDELRSAWESACAGAGVALVVDSAPGFGAVGEDGRPLAGQGDAEVFSFHATKPFAIGEGGLVVTPDPALAGKLRELANFGFDEGLVRDLPGLNAKLSEWHAAVALAVLDGFGDVLARRRTHAAELRDLIEPLGYELQAGCEHGPWQFVPALAPSRAARDEALATARAAGIELRSYFDPPLNEMPAFRDVPRADPLETTASLAARAISLPMANSWPPGTTEAIARCLEA
jgi:dTDP-4-amino-4,6-dideoxygalactose transaminase